MQQDRCAPRMMMRNFLLERVNPYQNNMIKGKLMNQLAQEKSLYLQQHKENPVNWMPYSPSAIAMAKQENKPVFLSVGYSSCHWCHVMAHESFEDQETAELLNKNFICIKVDREEYPDLDTYYQKACQLMTGSGGWPLSVFLLPDMRPFFSGTYFPKVGTQNRPGFKQILGELARAYQSNKDVVEGNALKLTEAMKGQEITKEKVEFKGEFPAPQAIMNAVKKVIDEKNGGIGQAPKFPHFSFLSWGLEQVMEGMLPKEYADFFIKTCEHMLCGAIFDHARGGIHRYSVDEKWLVPHFEKMLYDQAGLLKVLARLQIVHPSPLVLDALITTLDYLETEMLSEKNYFFSAQDADSEGVEGLYFTFKAEEFEQALRDNIEGVSDEDVSQLKQWMQITPEGNFEHGLNVISLNYELREQWQNQSGWDLVRKARQAILSERRNRIPPATDNKGLVGWNALVLGALTDVFQYSRIDAIKKRASELLTKVSGPFFQTFIKQRKDGSSHLVHSTSLEKDGPELFENYAYLMHFQWRLFEVSGTESFKQNAFETLQFIRKEFFKDGVFLTRSLSSTDAHLFPNQEVSLFENSYESPLMGLVGDIRRMAVALGDRELNDFFESIRESLTQQILRSPLGSGEGLRALTYPAAIYRKISVPRAWMKNAEFLFFQGNLLPRFVMEYHDQADGWQICNIQACEKQGKNWDEFKAVFAPKNNQS